MRQLRSSGSVEGVMGNHDPYSDSPCAGGHRKVNQSALRALAAARRPFGVRSDVQARLSCGLAAPRNVGLHPAQAKSIISPTRMYFHALRMSQSDMTTQFSVVSCQPSRKSKVESKKRSRVSDFSTFDFQLWTGVFDVPRTPCPVRLQLSRGRFAAGGAGRLVRGAEHA